MVLTVVSKMTNFGIQFKSNNSQIFLLDFIFATVLIIVSLGTFLAYYSLSDPQEDLFDIAYRLSDTMSTTNINELNNDFVRNLFINREITNVDNTLFQQISEFYQRGEYSLADNLTKEITDSFLIERIGYEITVFNGSGSSRVLDNSSLALNRDESKTVASVQRQIFGFQDNNPFTHVYEIEVWRN